MAQYWIQTPVENAKEVIQRKIDELVTAGTLPLLEGYTVSYDENCEVVFDGNYILNTYSQNLNNIYFGTWVANFDGLALNMGIGDGFNSYYTQFITPTAGHYPYIIWNFIEFDGWDGTQGYFFGYKFTLTAP